MDSREWWAKFEGMAAEGKLRCNVCKRQITAERNSFDVLYGETPKGRTVRKPICRRCADLTAEQW